MRRVQIAVPVSGSTTQYSIAGQLPDCLSCTVRQEYNTGVYQLDMQYLPGGEFASMLTIGNAIVCTPNGMHGPQTFRIAKIRRGLSEAIAVTAYHISYIHASEICAPFLNGGQSWNAVQAWNAAIAAIVNPIGTKYCGITSTAAGAFGVHLLQPKSFRDLILDQLIPAYGGAITFDGIAIQWMPETNPDRGVHLQGGVNVVGCVAETDTSDMESGIYPYYGEKGNEYTPYIDLGEAISYELPIPENIIPIDFTASFETPPTAAKLRSVAVKYAQKRAAEYHPYALTVDRVPDDAIIMPGDTVHINVRQLGISVDRIVTAITFDVLRGVVEAVEVGDQTKNTLAKILAGEMR